MTRVTKKITMDFNVRAVDQPDNILLGAVRMSAKEGWVNWVYGITGMFYAKKDVGLIVFDKGSLFFYGIKDHYNKNALKLQSVGGVPISGNMSLPEGPSRFKDKEYAPSSQTDIRCCQGVEKDIKFGVLRIPIDQIPFAEKQRRLIGLVGEEAEQQLPTLLEDLVYKTINPEHAGRSIGSALFHFPHELSDAANQVNSYYHTRKIKVEEPIKLFADKRPKIWSSPTGGLPDWARDYMRKHRR